jgi:hypothetical protein
MASCISAAAVEEFLEQGRKAEIFEKMLQDKMVQSNMGNILPARTTTMCSKKLLLLLLHCSGYQRNGH